MVVPLTMAGASGSGYGTTAKIVRSGDQFCAQAVGSVSIFSAIGLRDSSLEQAIETAIRVQKLSGMKSVRRDTHEAVETCILHTSGACVSGADANSRVL
jgi:hypothetical protein